jgi:hypothetical protein
MAVRRGRDHLGGSRPTSLLDPSHPALTSPPWELLPMRRSRVRSAVTRARRRCRGTPASGSTAARAAGRRCGRSKATAACSARTRIRCAHRSRKASRGADYAPSARRHRTSMRAPSATSASISAFVSGGRPCRFRDDRTSARSCASERDHRHPFRLRDRVGRGPVDSELAHRDRRALARSSRRSHRDLRGSDTPSTHIVRPRAAPEAPGHIDMVTAPVGLLRLDHDLEGVA